MLLSYQPSFFYYFCAFTRPLLIPSVDIYDCLSAGRVRGFSRGTLLIPSVDIYDCLSAGRVRGSSRGILLIPYMDIGP